MNSEIRGWFDRATTSWREPCLYWLAASLLVLTGCTDSTAGTQPPPSTESRAESTNVESEHQPSVDPPVDEAQGPAPPPTDDDGDGDGDEADPQGESEASVDPNDGASFARWIEERQREARAGTPEPVRVPLVFTNDAWPSVPRNFLGGSHVAHNGGETWALVELNPGLEFPRPEIIDLGDGLEMEDSMIVLVEGYFTGETEISDRREDPDSPRESAYHYFRLARLRVTRVLRALEPEDVPSPQILESAPRERSP